MNMTSTTSPSISSKIAQLISRKRSPRNSNAPQLPPDTSPKAMLSLTSHIDSLMSDTTDSTMKSPSYTKDSDIDTAYVGERRSLDNSDIDEDDESVAIRDLRIDIKDGIEQQSETVSWQHSAVNTCTITEPIFTSAAMSSCNSTPVYTCTISSTTTTSSHGSAVSISANDSTLHSHTPPLSIMSATIGKQSLMSLAESCPDLHNLDTGTKKRKLSGATLTDNSISASIQAAMGPLMEQLISSNRDIVDSNKKILDSNIALTSRIDEHLTAYSKLSEEFNTYKDKVTTLESQIQKYDFAKIEQQQKTLQDHDMEIKKLRNDVERQNNALRYNYILIRNVPEKNDNNPGALHNYVSEVLSHVAPSVQWKGQTRLGPKSDKDRPIKVKMCTSEDRDLVIKGRKKSYDIKILEKTPVITDWISDKEQQNHNILWKIGNALRENGDHWIHIPCSTPRVLLYKHSKFKDDKKVSPYKFTMDDYHKGRKIEHIPDYVYDQRNHLELENGDVVFASDKQWLSNHYSEVEFSVEGETFTSVEQYIGIDRARRAKDTRAENEIKQMKTGLEIMRRMNTIPATLEQTYNAMHKAQMSKFSTPELKSKLLSIKGQIFEGTADLRFGMGISLKYNFPGMLHRSWWPTDAQNLAGRSIMDIRNIFLNAL